MSHISQRDLLAGSLASNSGDGRDRSIPNSSVVPGGISSSQQSLSSGNASSNSNPIAGTGATITGGNAPFPTAIPLEKNVQFRVMRLYKPSLYISPSLPSLVVPSISTKDLQGGSLLSSSSEFTISPHILLPDSFGDIYLGETFSAYVAVVNVNQDVSLFNVILSIRLQTTNAVHDLTNIRPSADPASVLGPNESLDMIVSNPLNELGTHTLAVSASFSTSRSSEPTKVKKFYRFNVSQPLSIASCCTEIGNKIMVQSQVTNIAKSAIYLEEVNFDASIPDTKVMRVDIPPVAPTMCPSNLPSPVDTDRFQLLNPNESFAFSFVIDSPIYQLSSLRSVGCPEIKWSSSLGESGIYRGIDALYSSAGGLFASNRGSLTALTFANQPIAAIVPTVADSKSVQIRCMVMPPSPVMVGEEFPVHLRITNGTPQPMTLSLHCGISQINNDNSNNNNNNNNNNSSSSNNNSGSSLGQEDTSGLLVVGLATINLGLLPAGGFVDKTVVVLPLSAGLHELKDIAVVDTATSKEFTSGTLCKVMILEFDNPIDEPSEHINSSTGVDMDVGYSNYQDESTRNNTYIVETTNPNEV